MALRKEAFKRQYNKAFPDVFQENYRELEEALQRMAGSKGLGVGNRGRGAKGQRGKGQRGRGVEGQRGDPVVEFGALLEQANREASELYGGGDGLTDEERRQMQDLKRRKGDLQPVELGVMGSRRIRGNPYSIDTRQLFTGIGDAIEGVANYELERRREGDPETVEEARAKKEELQQKIKANTRAGFNDSEAELFSETFRGARALGQILPEEDIEAMRGEVADLDNRIQRYTGVTQRLDDMQQRSERQKEIEQKKRAYVQNRVQDLIGQKFKMDYLNRQMGGGNQSEKDGGRNNGVQSTATDRGRIVGALSGSMDYVDDRLGDLSDVITDIEAGNIDVNYSPDQIGKLKATRNKLIKYKQDINPLLIKAEEELATNGIVSSNTQKKIMELHNQYQNLLGWGIEQDDETGALNPFQITGDPTDPNSSFYNRNSSTQVPYRSEIQTEL